MDIPRFYHCCPSSLPFPLPRFSVSHPTCFVTFPFFAVDSILTFFRPLLHSLYISPFHLSLLISFQYFPQYSLEIPLRSHFPLLSSLSLTYFTLPLSYPLLYRSFLCHTPSYYTPFQHLFIYKSTTPCYSPFPSRLPFASPFTPFVSYIPFPPPTSLNICHLFTPPIHLQIHNPMLFPFPFSTSYRLSLHPFVLQHTLSPPAPFNVTHLFTPPIHLQIQIPCSHSSTILNPLSFPLSYLPSHVLSLNPFEPQHTLSPPVSYNVCHLFTHPFICQSLLLNVSDEPRCLHPNRYADGLFQRLQWKICPYLRILHDKAVSAWEN